jgi:hypothetical protein
VEIISLPDSQPDDDGTAQQLPTKTAGVRAKAGEHQHCTIFFIFLLWTPHYCNLFLIPCNAGGHRLSFYIFLVCFMSTLLHIFL